MLYKGTSTCIYVYFNNQNYLIYLIKNKLQYTTSPASYK